MAKQNVKPTPKTGDSAAVKGARPPLVVVETQDKPITPLTWQEIKVVLGLLLAGFLVRLFFMPATGHETDVGTFESWTLSLIKYGIKNFYAHAGFVDYPPGYMFILGAFGWIYQHLSQTNINWPIDLLKFTIKSPAVLADLGLAYLTFLLVRRTWSSGAGLWTMAIVAFNPAVWYVSAYWGQADSVTAVFVVWSVYMMITRRYEIGWLLFAFAVLIKPQPVVIAPLLLVWQLRTSRQYWRLIFIPIIGFAVAYLGSLPFAPVTSPPQVLTWLYDRYHTGTALYPYNSCNAFNLYSTRLDFWQPDNKLIPNLPNFPGWPQWLWGVTIVGALIFAITLREWRTVSSEYNRQERESGLYMALFVGLLGFFMFATRMHERYLFSALAMGPLIWNIGPLNRIVYGILSGTFLVNLWYAIQYLYNPSADLYPWLVHPLSILNVICLFLVAGAYLVPEMGESLNTTVNWIETRLLERGAARKRVPLAREGLVGLTRVDGLIIGGLMILTGFLLFINISVPRERIFDEIYYARSALEYLHHRPQFEWTHPPLSKLFLTLGAWFFGKFGLGDNCAAGMTPSTCVGFPPVGERMMSAIFGVLTVPLLYAFAKRLFASSTAAVVSVLLLLTSGYFYAQSRIATPEIFVAFFALATIYCTYRFWLAAQIVKSNAGTIYPDGTQTSGGSVQFPFGERIPLKNAKLDVDGQSARWNNDGVTLEEQGNQLQWRSDASITGTLGGKAIQDRQQWAFWMIMTALAVACVIASKWNGLFDLAGIWVVALSVSLQRKLPWTPSAEPESSSGGGASSSAASEPPRRWLWGNAFGFRMPIFVAVALACIAVIYLITNIPFFLIGNANLGLSGTLHDFFALQSQMYHYHHDLKATHPYSSAWWTWPFELRPVSYYYHVFSGTQAPNQIVAEVIALPNPIMWLAGVITVPLAGIVAWRERHKGMMLCVAAYLFQWLPWIFSTRIDFQYNFYPNCAIICLCTTYVLVKLWQAAANVSRPAVLRGAVAAYLVACILSFAFFLPILSGQKMTWKQWDARIWYKDGVPHPYGWI